MSSLFHDLWVLCQPLAIAALSRTLFMFSSFNNMLKFAIVTTARAMRRNRSRRRKRRKPRRELNGDLVWAPCPSFSKLVGETSGDFSQLIILLGNCDPTDEKKQPLSLSVFDHQSTIDEPHDLSISPFGESCVYCCILSMLTPEKALQYVGSSIIPFPIFSVAVYLVDKKQITRKNFSI